MSDRLKSAWEIALEKLEKSDPQPARTRLSDDQKARIADVRREIKAKLAEIEVLHRSASQEAARQGDAEKLALLTSDYESERRKLQEREAERVAAIRDERGGDDA